MKKQTWIEKIVESSPARVLLFSVFILLIGSFAFLAFRANADLTASRVIQLSLAQQSRDIHRAGSLNDFYDRGWLANDQNFAELADYVDKLLHFSASPSLDPKFRQDLSDYVQRNLSQLPKESDQIRSLAFSEQILKEHQFLLLDMYDQLELIFQTMGDILSGWNLAEPQMRGEEMISIQNAFSLAQVEFQATTASHRQILEYAKLLSTQSKQDSAAMVANIRTHQDQLTFSLVGLTVSMILFAAWVTFLVYHRGRMKKEE